ncbi:MAG: enoyl-CoA hydratase/isomerase family protein [Smithellaceae bacterium]
MNENKESLPVIFRLSKSMAAIVLNRPEILNSLNIAMIRSITRCLQEAQASEKCKFIFFYGNGSKGFCAGGDIKELAQKVKEKAYDQARSFFAEEYILDLMIHNCPKPVIVIADGITMGGGLGIAAGADIVIATERTRMAMPETRIGFFPDVGATGWMFSKCPHGYPEYLGLTGYDMQGMECVRLGLATHFTKATAIPELIKSLEEYKPEKVLNKESLLSGLKNQLVKFFDFNIPRNQDMDAWVFEYFSGKSDLQEILASLSHCTSQTKLCNEVFDGIKERSPTALALTLKLLRHNEGRPLPEVFAADLKAAQYIIRHPDYIEGVRARLLDKDNMPLWNPDKLSKVDLTNLKL